MSKLVKSPAVKGRYLLVGTWDGVWRATDILTAVDDNYQLPITNYRLHQNYPNPFNPTTTIEFSLPKRSDVSVTIWNTIGQKIETLVDGEREPGIHRIVWNAASMPSGVYLYQLETSGFKAARKMLLLR